MDDKLEGRLREWLETSGRSLELRVSRTLRAAGAGVRPSFRFVDPTSRQLRESDVLAQFGWPGPQGIPCSLTAVVECKSSRKHPWVAFYDRRLTPAKSLSSWFTFAHGPFTTITDPLLELWKGSPPFDEMRVATHAVAAFAGDHDPVHDALRQVLSAAGAIRDDYISHQVERRVGLVVMPLIVIEAPIVRCSLDQSGAINLQEVDLVHVWANGVSDSPQRVYVLNEGRLAAFAQALANLAELAGSPDLTT